MLLVAATAATFATPAVAGGGPENVLLLVNSNSESSKTIANYYIDLRKIPASNVLYVDWKGSLEIAQGINVRDKILQPALKALEDRQISQQIDYIVYSTDFPWRVELQSIFPDHKFEIPFDPSASITGATYLTPFVMGKSPAIVDAGANWYVPGPIQPNVAQCAELSKVRSRGFHSRYLWDPEGNRTNDAKVGQRYLLSTMLGVTQGRGNTVEEILSYLRRAKAADTAAGEGRHPQGTIYFMWNKDIRSATRDRCFEQVAAQINLLGVRAKVQQGRVPDGAKDVTGMMVGTPDFDLKKSGITILPGAICEHLTSAGGILTKGDFQTPLSEFLRHGAAGASGTVVEPRAIQAKFPLPSLQLHYARGCSLAESFYQSISGPYQILVVGDPLCQPWATLPKVAVDGIKAGQKVSGTISIKPISGVLSRKIASFDVFVDGRLVARNAPGNTLEMDTSKLPDGYHELRIVGTAADAIETQGRIVVPILVQNHDGQLELKTSTPNVKLSENLRLSVRQPGATTIRVRQNSRDLGSVQGEAGEIAIPAATLGRGRCMLQAFSEGKVPVASAPIYVVVE